MKENEYIKISVIKYNDLISKRQSYDTLINCIFDSCTLSYDKKRLVFDDNILLIMKSLCPLSYKYRLEELQEIEEKN